MATRAAKSTKLAHSASKTETESKSEPRSASPPPHLSGRTASVSGTEASWAFFMPKSKVFLLLLLLLFYFRSSKRSCSAYARWHFDDFKSSLTHSHTHRHCTYAAAGVQCIHPPYIWIYIVHICMQIWALDAHRLKAACSSELPQCMMHVHNICCTYICMYTWYICIDIAGYVYIQLNM